MNQISRRKPMEIWDFSKVGYRGLQVFPYISKAATRGVS